MFAPETVRHPFICKGPLGDCEVNMDEAAREALNAYQREYRKAHPEKVRQWKENYWKRRAAKIAEGGADGRDEKKSA